jgi:predicted aspartyl protease
MKGRVIEAAEIVVPLILFDNDDRPAEIDSILDTGATCALTLPPEALEELGSTFLRDDLAQVAGDEIIPCRVFEIDVLWTAGRRTIEVFELDSVPLLGLQLLADHV